MADDNLWPNIITKERHLNENCSLMADDDLWLDEDYSLMADDNLWPNIITKKRHLDENYSLMADGNLWPNVIIKKRRLDENYSLSPNEASSVPGPSSEPSTGHSSKSKTCSNGKDVLKLRNRRKRRARSNVLPRKSHSKSHDRRSRNVANAGSDVSSSSAAGLSTLVPKGCRRRCPRKPKGKKARKTFSEARKRCNSNPARRKSRPHKKRKLKTISSPKSASSSSETYDAELKEQFLTTREAYYLPDKETGCCSKPRVEVPTWRYKSLSSSSSTEDLTSEDSILQLLPCDKIGSISQQRNLELEREEHLMRRDFELPSLSEDSEVQILYESIKEFGIPSAPGDVNGDSPQKKLEAENMPSAANEMEEENRDIVERPVDSGVNDSAPENLRLETLTSVDDDIEVLYVSIKKFGITSAPGDSPPKNL